MRFHGGSIMLLISMFLISCDKKETLSEVVERGLNVSSQQTMFLAEELENQEKKLPRTYENNELKTVGYKSWVSGFFPGVLWYLYENDPTEELKRYAELYTSRVEPAKNMTSTHDLGFMLYCSFGNGYRLTHDSTYLEVLKTGSKSLATRFNSKIGAINSWGARGKWQYPVIIDNMMNLEMLSFVAKKTGKESYMDMINAHAQTTLKQHFRPDNSCYHVVDYDKIKGGVRSRQTAQGYADESSWARGQAWALYGYTVCYRETKDKKYLEQAQKVYDFIFNNKNMPEDLVPYWDFDAPHIPNEPRDASAAAVIASALYELSTYDNSKEYKKTADKIIESLSSPAYLAIVGTNGNFVLMHSVGSIPHHSEIDLPLNYADYYYLEALTRKINLEKK